MNTEGTHILTVNAGSSSIKFDLFEAAAPVHKMLSGSVDAIGQDAASFTVTDLESTDHFTQTVQAPDHVAAVRVMIDWIHEQLASLRLVAIGHRIVHGGPRYYLPTLVDDTVLTALRELVLFDPEHVPLEVELIATLQSIFPDIPQIACFDTAFHHDLPTPARMLPIPRRYEKSGVRRYGFHGLSYTYLIKELRRIAGADAADGRVILAHLGSGVSLTAVRNSLSVDTTMALTPAAGVPMSTRSGDLDPGLAYYLARSENMSPEAFNDLVSFRSGLLGVSETTADMKQLLAMEGQDQRAKEAIDLFCYQIKKQIGALAATLGGLNAIVFSGGIGDKAPIVRARICNGLEFLGIKLDEERNRANDAVISAADSPVTVYAIPTDESQTIADGVMTVLGSNI